MGLESRYLVTAPYGQRANFLWWATIDDFIEYSGVEQIDRGLIERHESGLGLLTASKAIPVASDFRITRHEDPILVFDHFKTVLAVKYRLKDRSDSLLVVNIHSFVSIDHQEQKSLLQLAEELMQDHVGPILFAGDFNTWTKNKTRIVQDLAGRLDLDRVPVDAVYDAGILGTVVLDHGFVRGMSWENIQVFSDPKGVLSDHSAIAVDFQIL